MCVTDYPGSEIGVVTSFDDPLPSQLLSSANLPSATFFTFSETPFEGWLLLFFLLIVTVGH
jgi:hypothetical protein